MFDFSGIFGVERFKIWCQKVLPTVYDDSLSYMELLCKVLKVLEEYGKGSAEIAEQVVLLKGELEKVKEDIAQLTENGGKTDEQVGANTDAIAALGERVGAVEQQVVSIAESLVTVRDDITAIDERVSATEQQVVSIGESIVTVRDDITALGERVSATEQQVVTMDENLESLGDTVNTKVGGKTAYLGEYVNMGDVPADAVIVGGNGTEGEPYNAFEAGGSKEHGGWVRVGEEVVPESDFKKLKEISVGGDDEWLSLEDMWNTASKLTKDDCGTWCMRVDTDYDESVSVFGEGVSISPVYFEFYDEGNGNIVPTIGCGSVVLDDSFTTHLYTAYFSPLLTSEDILFFCDLVNGVTVFRDAITNYYFKKVN